MADVLEALVAEAHALAETIDAPDHEVTAEERAKADDLLTRAAAAAEARRSAQEDHARKDALERLFLPEPGGKGLAIKPDEVTPPPARGLVKASDAFLGSQTYQRFKADYPSGVPDSSRLGSLVPVPLPPGSFKATTPVTSVSAGGLGPPPDRVAMPPFPWGPPFTLMDAVTPGTTQSDVVEYAQLTTATSAAAAVAEATDTAGATGLKPQSNLVFGKVTAPVRTIAHWIAATKRTLMDAGQLRTLIDSFMVYGIEKAEQNEVVNGDGTGEHFLGILATPGILSLAWPGTGTPAMIDQLRKGITAVQWTGLDQPNAVALNPADNEALDLAKDGQQRYFGAGPFGAGPSTIWGLPRIVSDALPVKVAIVANFRQAVLWDREQETITASDSHADFFTRNLVAILGEERAAFGIFRPSAFCKVATAA